jgi:hypothetical protein
MGLPAYAFRLFPCERQGRRKEANSGLRHFSFRCRPFNQGRGLGGCRNPVPYYVVLVYVRLTPSLKSTIFACFLKSMQRRLKAVR